MARDSAKAFVESPIVKLIGLVVTVGLFVGGAYMGIVERQDEMNLKLTEFIAAQKGKDDVQDVQIRLNTEDMISVKDESKSLRLDFTAHVSREGTKPKPISVETE